MPMPASYVVPPKSPPTGTIVDRTMAILGENTTGGRHPAAPRVDELPTTLLSDLEKRVASLREQLQDLVDELTRLGERLPASTTVMPNPGLAASSPLALVDQTNLPMLRQAEASIGEMARTVLALVNDGEQPVNVVLRATNLIADSGDAIPGELVNFAPNPLNLPGNSELPVLTKLRVPAGIRPGRYVGLVQAAGLEAARAVMTVVVPAAGGT
jgi:hypothetical protein